MQLKETFENVKAASRKLNLLSDLQRNEILKAVADAIIAKKGTILEANALDLAKMDKQNPLYDDGETFGRHCQRHAQRG